MLRRLPKFPIASTLLPELLKHSLSPTTPYQTSHYLAISAPPHDQSIRQLRNRETPIRAVLVSIVLSIAPIYTICGLIPEYHLVPIRLPARHIPSHPSTRYAKYSAIAHQDLSRSRSSSPISYSSLLLTSQSVYAAPIRPRAPNAGINERLDTCILFRAKKRGTKINQHRLI